MTRERWGQIKSAFEAALARPVAEREECIRSLCGTDSELESEVKALLEANDSAQSFLQAPAAAVIGYVPPDGGPRTLAPGEVLAGRFEIVRFLNRGGMGEVYEAWDRELKDHIALKTIRPEIASSPAVLERFKQEVKRARGISHPNVCRVYDLFNHVEAPGQMVWFLTMELLRGQSLAEWLRSHGSMKPEQALELVKQMASGLAAAHELGIVHRDFKSGNVMLVEGDNNRLRALVTDFGLALSVKEGDRPPAPATSGTPDYMAPEQAQGKAVGVAADQFALGIVMCEMLSGHRPQRSGEQLILPTEQRFPARWTAVIRRCLQNRPQDRFKSISELISALEPPRSRKTAWWTGTAAVVGLTLVAIAGVSGGGLKDRVQGAVKVTSETDLSTNPSLSRDGKALAYVSDRGGSSDVWVQRLPVTSAPVRVATAATPQGAISISPDGGTVAFRSEKNGGGVYLAQTGGGGERLLAPGGRDPRFSPDGQRILYWQGDEDDTVADGQLYVVSVSGGAPGRIASSFQDARYGIWSANGEYILFTGCREASQSLETCREWWIVSVNGKNLVNTGALRILRAQGISISRNTTGEWYKDKIIFSGRSNNTNSLWEIRLSPRDLKAVGSASQLTSGNNREINPSLADDGSIAYRHLIGALHIWRMDHASSPQPTEATRITDDVGIDSFPYVSHNGRWLAYARYRNVGEHDHIEIRDLNLGNVIHIAESYSEPAFPLIDDSGAKVVFEAKQDHIPEIFISFRGSPPRKLCTACNSPAGWFDDSRAILYRSGIPSSIKIIYPDTGESRTVAEGNGLSLANASWSPENQYLLFTAAKGSKNQIFAVRFPASTAKTVGSWIPITDESKWADRPRWSGDGRTIFYISTRDGFRCIWGRHFEPKSGQTQGPPFAVKHYHNGRISPAFVLWEYFNLAAAGNSIYFNPGEQNGTIWIGKLKREDPLHFLGWFW